MLNKFKRKTGKLLQKFQIFNFVCREGPHIVVGFVKVLVDKEGLQNLLILDFDFSLQHKDDNNVRTKNFRGMKKYGRYHHLPPPPYPPASETATTNANSANATCK
jgi:hypothetical protein